VALAHETRVPHERAIPLLRWWIGGLLFVSTVINYIDRQTLSILAPYLKLDYHWTNADYANIAIAFRIAYTIGQTVWGRQIDRVGTRRANHQCDLVFDRFAVHFACEWPRELRGVSFLARRR
jgi:ACS family hexuronate transporter-like MFS transporter